MKKFGFSKKGEDNDDSNRSALFGSRKKDKSTPPASNPYAAPPANDPYANPPPYQNQNGASDQYRRDKSPAVTAPGGRYSNGVGIGAANNRYNGGGNYGSGGGGGYGANPYGGGVAQAAQESRRPGGYGGMGRTNSQDTMSTDAGRDALFGNAPTRYQQQQQSGAYGASGAYGSGASGAYGNDGQSGGYGSYESRELTEGEREEEEVQGTKDEIRRMKQQDKSSLQNALRLAAQAEETGQDTVSRVRAQGERIHNTERHLDMSYNEGRIAEEKARELKTLNKSMFAMHVGNPFTSNARKEERDRKIVETHRQEREQRDATRKAAWESQARGEAFQKGMQSMGNGPGQKSTLADRAKYQFEADSEDDELENDIDEGINQLHGAAKRLNALGRAMGNEVDTQNKHIDRIIQKTDKVDDQIAMNRARLERIK